MTEIDRLIAKWKAYSFIRDSDEEQVRQDLQDFQDRLVAAYAGRDVPKG